MLPAVRRPGGKRDYGFAFELSCRRLRQAQPRAEEFAGEAFTTIQTGSQDGWQHLLKRTLDVSASLVAMLLMSPLFLLATLIVKLTSPGPIFFVQERVGLNKRRFRLYKFRTMVADAEGRQREIECLNEASGPVFKIRNDPRVARGEVPEKDEH